MILVLGYGVSGKAAMSLLKKQKIEAVALDRNPMLGVPPDSADFSLEGFSQVIVSPGISPLHPLVIKAKRQKIEVIGEIEFALRQIKNRCVGITGSNGKTTTTLLIAHALKYAGIKARALGNIGASLSSYLLEPDLEETILLELSSFQLETLRAKKLDLALYLNLSPNHLDRHASLEEYAKIKANIQNCLKPNGKLLVSSDVWRLYKQIFDPKNVQIFDSVVQHDISSYFLAEQNVAAAIQVCSFFGVSEKMFMDALPMFEKPPHRIEWVAERDGILYYNDSKASSVEAVMHAVSFFSGPLILIAGGLDKGAPYLPWIDSFRGKVKKIVAYGDASAKMQKEIAPFYEVERVHLFKEAVWMARKSAKRGDTILLSPGCSSYDQFKNFEERGNVFKELVLETTGVCS